MDICICMPSYNRGSLALEHIRWMEERLPEDIGFFVLDNASEEDTEGYGELARDPRVRYVRLEKNTRIHGAFSACVEHNRGVIVFCSDEDVIPPEAIEDLRGVDWSRVSVVRGSVGELAGHSDDAYQLEYGELPKGRDAVLGFTFQHSYMSGSCYNLDLLEPNLPRYFAEVWKWEEYMIFWLDLIAAVSGDALLWSRNTALAGPNAPNIVDINLTAWRAKGHLSFGSRIDQHLAYRDGVLSAASIARDNGVFALGYLKATMWSLRMCAEVNARWWGMSGQDERTNIRMMADYAHGVLDRIDGVPPELMVSIHKDIDRLKFIALDVFQKKCEEYAETHSGSGSEPQREDGDGDTPDREGE